MYLKADLVEKFDTTEVTLKVYSNGFIESFTKENAFIDVPYLIEEKRRLLCLGIRKKFFVLSESAGFFRISRPARELCASKEYSDHLAAVAVVADHFSTRLVMDLYFKINKPVTPTKAFNNREQAMLWLESMMPQPEKKPEPLKQG